MEEPKAGRMKLGLAACIVVIVCLLVFSGWTYSRINDLQKEATELEIQVADLESLVSSLETDVENLTNTIDNVTFPFMGTEKVEIQKVTWTSPNLVTLNVENTGTKAVTITGVKVNYGNVECSSPTIPKTIDTGSLEDIQITFASNYTAGTTYDLTVVTSDGHEYTRTATGGQNIT
jgi:hypothetical protein